MALTADQEAKLAALADALPDASSAAAGGGVVASVGAAVADAIASGIITPEQIGDALGASLIDSMVVIQLQGALRRAEAALTADQNEHANAIEAIRAQLQAATARRDGVEA